MPETKSCCIISSPNIPERDLPALRAKVEDAVAQAIHEGYTHFLSGFAIGPELFFAEAVANVIQEKNIALILEAVLPTHESMDQRDPHFVGLLEQCGGVAVFPRKDSADAVDPDYVRYLIQSSERVISVMKGHSEIVAFPLRLAATLEKELYVIEF